MRNFKDSYKGQDIIKVRKNRNSTSDSIFYTFFTHYRKEPMFLYEDDEFNIDAELEADFVEGIA